MNKFIIKATNFKNASASLHISLMEYKENPNLTIRDGVLQRFEFTTDLAWKTMREYLLTQGVININTPRAVLIEAFNNNIIADGEGWLQLIHDRNLVPDIYQDDDLNKIFNRLVEKHIILLDALQREFEKLLNLEISNDSNQNFKKE